MEARGLGRVYRPMYPEKKAGEKTGKRKQSAVWWIQYSLRGKVYRENAHSTNRVDAVKLLKRRLGEIGRGKLIGPQEERVTFDALVADFLRDYEVRGLRSLDTARGRVAHLCAFFGGDRALDIATASAPTKRIDFRKRQRLARSTERRRHSPGCLLSL